MENEADGERLTKAKYIEWAMSLFGACLIAFGLGVLFAGFFSQFAYLIILTGIFVHGWGMYKIHERNR